MKRFFHGKRHLFIILIICIAAILTLSYLVIGENNLTAFDQKVNNGIFAINSENLDGALLFLTNLFGEPYFVILALLLIGVQIYRKKWHNAILSMIALGAGFVIESLIKITIQRIRPEHSLPEDSLYSFPSGHATMSAIFFIMIFYCFKDDIKNNVARWIFLAFNIIMILLVGFSRIYFHVHWLSDIIGGIVLGLMMVIFCILAINFSKEEFLGKHKWLKYI